ncbi:cobyrinate a,c-diamide synthase [Caproiciproducens sp. CPB-2]|uniref:cobyrinate a,c-diamide synthase n=1 Tax=Caproiciproducens sp. CPB-2 TaxID=3030017 RepID=UPI0023DB9E14|nr:cobyrinate a,c-diamide synthase [Caproiciproducens sp. CPB-2]MDF1495617.1 cobyrinate a,c-diamide synthase [Caproiciproducens sp. CPB-2]
MKAPRIMIAAAGSGSGKTLLTCSLLQALLDSGKRAAAFKCGPDFIDPMFHRKVLGVPSKNLDSYFTDENTTKFLFLEDAEGKDLSVIEGVMGLYDGLGGVKEEASSYHLAKVTKTPVILVVDARGMGRSVIPLIAGFLQYDTARLIQGVILNRTGKMFYDVIKPEIEAETGIPVLGYFPVQTEIRLESRHLGLRLPEEIGGLREQLKKSAEVFRTAVDLEKLMMIASRAEELEAAPVTVPAKADGVRIGVAMDEAFCFYYEDNLRLLQKAGAELIPFSPLREEKLPARLHGLILGGGYPELYAEGLSRNEGMRQSVKEAIESGMPSIAECGGFLYLHETMENQEGQAFPMAGAVKGSCRYRGKLVRFGYIGVRAETETFLPKGTEIRGHEFHYFDSTDNGSACLARKPVSGRQWRCVHAGKNHWWGFPHLYYYANPAYADRFLGRAESYAQGS